jgi:CRP-like cAMP-binding protein/AmiR/NasT family two-component response regulator
MKPKNVLIIEDNPDIRESTAEILALAGYAVAQADNGKTGVEQAVANPPDIILCDIMMPELDGYGVLYLLNKNPATAAIPFIFLTAKAERVDLRKGMEMGADDYLTKPFDDMELLNAVESRLQKRDQQKAFYSQSLEHLGTLAGRTNGAAELQRLIAERKVRTVKKKQIVYYEGDHPAGIYLVHSGKIKTVKLNDDGRELLTSFYGPEEYFGIHSLLLNEEYRESAEAIEDTTLCMLPKELVEQVMARYPDIAQQFIRILANNIVEKEDQLMQLAYFSVRKRMAELLGRLYIQQKHDPLIRISRDDLAAMAGMATETVSRTLSDFKDEGLIGKKGSLIEILNVRKLQAMKN